MAEHYIKQKMYSRIVGMSSIHDDKSAPKAYYKNEAERGLAEPDGRINLSAPAEEPVSHLDVSVDQTSSKTSLPPSVKQPGNLNIPPRRLAFCGGGVRCVAHVGVLKALDSANLLGCVKEMIGISAGALFALLYVLGYSIRQIEELALKFDFTVLGAIEPEDILLFPMTLGLNSGEAVDKLITSILHQKGFDKDISFSELAKKTKLTFRCYATDLQKSKIKEMSVWTTPAMSIKTAVRASMCLPVLYSPVKEGDSLLVDGGLLHNLPLVFLTQAEIEETLCVLFVSGETVPKPIDSVLDFFKYIYDGALMMRNIPYIQKYKERLILIDTCHFGALSFDESEEVRAKFIKVALKASREFLKKARKPLRRVSVS
jgi:predicted acylesterase/phospholipase RssA